MKGGETTSAFAGFFPLEKQNEGGSVIVRAIWVTMDYVGKRNLISSYKKKVLSKSEFSQAFRG